MKKIDKQVRLKSVEGDASDFTDVIGKTGRLYMDGQNNWFNAFNVDVITLVRKRVSVKDGIIRVATKLGNTFVFQVMGSQTNG